MKIKSYLGEYAVEFKKTLTPDDVMNLSKSPLYIIDENVYSLYKKELFEKIPSQQLILIHASEENKSYLEAAKYIEKMIGLNIKKSSTIVSIGGGITQDISCFISHIYRRGLVWHFLPTTLLAQADSCIGSKSSINIGRFKNQIGTFYPPSKVLISTSFLNTLSPEDIKSGIGEIIKLALIDGERTVNLTKDLLKGSIERNENLLPLIAKSLEIKKRFIEEDEFDTGIRNILNFGHTFGHGIETLTNFQIPHGISVLIGIHAAYFLSEALSFLPQGSHKELLSWTRHLVLPFDEKLKNINSEQLIQVMKSDKKNVEDKIRFILPIDTIYGSIQIKNIEANQSLASILNDFLRNY